DQNSMCRSIGERVTRKQSRCGKHENAQHRNLETKHALGGDHYNRRGSFSKLPAFYEINPSLSEYFSNSAVVSTPSASIISYLCDSAVRVEILSWAAISFIVIPRLINSSTSRCRGVIFLF